MIMSKKILVIDDDSMNLKVAEFILSKKGGYEVLRAESGEDGIKILDENSVDLVLLDIEMPGMNGIATLKEIRKNDTYGEIPVMFLSASSDEPAEAAQLHTLGLITKPFLPTELIEQVEKVIGK